MPNWLQRLLYYLRSMRTRDELSLDSYELCATIGGKKMRLAHPKFHAFEKDGRVIIRWTGVVPIWVKPGSAISEIGVVRPDGSIFKLGAVPVPSTTRYDGEGVWELGYTMNQDH